MLGIRQLVTYWENVRGVTLKYLDVYPPDRLDFRPVESVFTARDQFQHLIASETMFVRGWLDDVWEFPWKDGKWCALELVDDSFENLDGIKKHYVQIHERALGFLQGLPPDLVVIDCLIEMPGVSEINENIIAGQL